MRSGTPVTAPTSLSGVISASVPRCGALALIIRLIGFYAFNVLLKWSMVRCQASLAAASS